MATYTLTDPPSTAIDRVRMLAGDRGAVIGGTRTLNATTCNFSNEELQFFIDNVDVTVADAIPFRAASDILKGLLVEFSSKGKGVSMKKVSKLTVDYEGRGLNKEILEKLIAKYDAMAQKHSLTSNRMFRVLGSRARLS